MRKIKLNIGSRKISLDFNDHFANLVKINQSLNFGASTNYQLRKMVYVDVPEIVGITGACENVDTLFKLGNRLGLPLFFTQTGQLSLEQSLQSFSAVWTVIHSGRDEEEEDARHLRQFRMTEEEFDLTTEGMTRRNYDEEKMYQALLKNIQGTIQSMIGQILTDNEAVLKTVYKRDLKKLIFAKTHDFLKITYEDSIELLNKNGYPNVKFGDDLKAEHEAKIVKILNNEKWELPVFIMKYPKEIKFFNMKVSTKEPRVCLSADLIFPYAGEGAGSSVREHDFKRLKDRLVTSQMYKLFLKRGGKYEDFSWYLDIVKKQTTNPHAGYGIGNDRVLQYVLAEKDIRNVSIFSLLNLQTGDFEKDRYGQAGILGIEKKNILLSIGKNKNKKALLTHIKRAVQNHRVILYATEKTHQFLLSHKIPSSLVYKISQNNKSPNIADLLERRVFDTIINIPTRDEREYQEMTDGQMIRQAAIHAGLAPITDTEVAMMVLDKLSEK